MSLLNRITGKRRPNFTLDLDQVIAKFGSAAPDWEERPIDFDLLRARFADACRDAKLTPMPPAEFEGLTKTLPVDAARRLAVFLSAFDLSEVQKTVLLLVDQNTLQGKVLLPLVTLSNDLTLLTPKLLQQSDVRLEEFARHFCAKLEVGIEGETADHSGQRLREIDYARLMKLAEGVKLSASDRVEYLRKLQEEEEKTMRPRRGKW
jgi:hypothetical protein